MPAVNHVGPTFDQLQILIRATFLDTKSVSPIIIDVLIVP